MKNSNHLEQKKGFAKCVTFSFYLKFFSTVMIFALLNLTFGCKNYFMVRQATGPVEEELANFQDQDKTLVVHFGNEALILETPKISSTKSNLIGFTDVNYTSAYKKEVDPNGKNQYLKKINNDESFVLKEVHIYTDKIYKDALPRVSIPLSAITKIEIYEKDKKATTLSYIAGIVFISAGAILGVSIVSSMAAPSTQSSCPFIYTFDGENYQLSGEIYSGCVLPNLERHDFLKLPQVDTTLTTYKLKITNEVKEIQHTNLMELWVFDHPADTKIGVDKYGNVHTLTNIIPPAKVENLKGADVKDLIVNKDSLYYTSLEIDNDLPLTDGLILEFPGTKLKEAKLLIRAKNSFVLDFMSGQYSNEFGDLYKKRNRRLKRAPAHLLQDWSNNQNIPLNVSVNKHGVWEEIDYYNIAGPIAFKDDVLSIPMDGSESNPLKVKLEFGRFFWDIDYVAMDYSDNAEINYQVIPIHTAIDQNGKDIRKTIKADDKRYYVQPKVGDMAVVDFEMPEMNNSDIRTLFLHSKGWYEILRNPTGEPDQNFVEKVDEPGHLNRFVHNYLERLTKE